MTKLIKKTQKGGSLLPDWNKIKTSLNYKNWGVSDYSDKGNFNAAWNAARRANEVYEALGLNIINESEITYTDEEGNPCAEMGMRSSNFTKGSKWEIVKDLKGYPSHAQGGVDIKLGKDGFSFARGEGMIKAEHGLVLSGFNNPLEYESMSKVLSQRNKHLNWVERGLNPDKYPKIDNGDGSFSTHRLAYSTGDNGEAYVYPTIIQNDKGELEQLDDNAAWEYAVKTNTAMVVPNVKLAEYYSQNGLIKH